MSNAKLRLYTNLYLTGVHENTLLTNPDLTRAELEAVNTMLQDILPDTPQGILEWFSDEPALHKKVVSLQLEVVEWNNRAFLSLEITPHKPLAEYEVLALEDFASETILAYLETPLQSRPIHSNGACFFVSLWDNQESVWLTEQEMTDLSLFLPAGRRSVSPLPQKKKPESTPLSHDMQVLLDLANDFGKIPGLTLTSVVMTPVPTRESEKEK